MWKVFKSGMENVTDDTWLVTKTKNKQLFKISSLLRVNKLYYWTPFLHSSDDLQKFFFRSFLWPMHFWTINFSPMATLFTSTTDCPQRKDNWKLPTIQCVRFFQKLLCVTTRDMGGEEVRRLKLLSVFSLLIWLMTRYLPFCGFGIVSSFWLELTELSPEVFNSCHTESDTFWWRWWCTDIWARTSM